MNAYGKYAGLGFQMVATVGLLGYAGYKIDQHWTTHIRSGSLQGSCLVSWMWKAWNNPRRFKTEKERMRTYPIIKTTFLSKQETPVRATKLSPLQIWTCQPILSCPLFLFLNSFPWNLSQMFPDSLCTDQTKTEWLLLIFRWTANCWNNTLEEIIINKGCIIDNQYVETNTAHTYTASIQNIYITPICKVYPIPWNLIDICL